MNKILLIMVVATMLFSCSKENTTTEKSEENPFFTEWQTPHGTPPFDLIKEEHYLPAFEKGIDEKVKEIESIANNSEEATFKNTIEALDYSGDLLKKVSGVFFNMTGALTNDNMQQISKDVAPKLSKLNDDIYLNENLFQRVKSLYENKDGLGLHGEELRLLEKYYKDFVRGGANLEADAKNRFREINEKLSVLTLKFGENVLKESNKYELIIENEADLAGLPDNVVSAAKEEAAQKGYDGKWLFTLQNPSRLPFLTYSDNRDLREKMYNAYINIGNNADELDNNQIASEIAALRVERAKLLGYDNHAAFILEENMAKTPENVYKLLMELWEPSLANAKKEAAELQALIKKEGKDFELKAWDWWYYSEKLRKEKYDLDEEEIRPYFELESVRNGAFDVATKLWGITFEERSDIPVYHEDVKAIEVKGADGGHIGILYVDYHPRESKRGGAWMNEYRTQHIDENGEYVTPIICNVCNFSKPTGDKPALLSLDEVQTLFHEFGHALHGLLSDCKYPSLAGTNVPRDFVELPSQIMENWATEPEVLKMYANHYETGEVMPDELIEKMQVSSKFNQGFVTTEYLAAAILDMDWHTQTEAQELNAIEFENKTKDRTKLIEQIEFRYRTPYFRHVFAGGYSAGYYSYIWSGVLDTDAFQAFKETSLFDKETAEKYRKYILSSGSKQDAMDLYVQFRGKEPSTDALLEKRGLK